MNATQKNIDEMISDLKLPQNVIDNLNRELKDRKVTKETDGRDRKTSLFRI